MATSRVRVWLGGENGVQHFADPPKEDTSRIWEGDTTCGRTGELRWITPENVDGPITCERCAELDSYTPPLEGDHPGPV